MTNIDRTALRKLCEEAPNLRAALRRFINVAFRNPGDKPRFSIPARPDHDDDLVLSSALDTFSTAIPALLDENDDLASRLARAEGENERLEKENAENQCVAELIEPIIHKTANALKGEPPPRTLHDWSDLPHVAARLRAALDAVHDALGEDRGSDDESVAEGVREWISAAKSADAEVERLRARIERLEAALRPFAILYEKHWRAAAGAYNPSLAVSFALLEQASAALGGDGKESGNG